MASKKATRESATKQTKAPKKKASAAKKAPASKAAAAKKAPKKKAPAEKPPKKKASAAKKAPARKAAPAAQKAPASTGFWLVKTEPETYSYDDLVAQGRTCWDLVRNYTARNNLKAMKIGDLALVYHSVGPREIVGIARVVRESYPDPQALAEGEPADRWVAVDLEPVAALKPVSLADCKAHPALKGMVFVRQSRLSVTPVQQAEWDAVLALGGQGEARPAGGRRARRLTGPGRARGSAGRCRAR